MHFQTDAFCGQVITCVLIAVCLVAVCSATWAADGEAQKGIIVNGHGEVKGQPDVARVMVGVVTQSKDQGQAATENAKIITTVRDALISKFRLSKKDLETFGYSIQPQYNYESRPPKVVGYQIRNAIRVSIRDMAKIGQVIDAATAAGANEVQGVSFEIEDEKPLRSEALVKALNDAREKAKLIAGTLQIPIGPVISVRESAAPPIMPYRFAAADAMMAAGGPETPIQPREMTVSSDVTVVFAIQSASGSAPR